MKTPPVKTILPVFIIFLLMLSGWFAFGSIGFYKAIVSKNWPTTEGKVTSSQVIRPSGKSTKYTAEVRYTYELDWKEYQSNRLKATSARGTSEWAKNAVGHYPVNSRIKVYYNPKNHGDSVVEPGLQPDNYWMTLAPLIFFILVLFTLIKQIKDRNKIA